MPTPWRTGYTFKGWFTSSGTPVTASSLVPEADWTLTAYWAAKSYTISFNPAGGKAVKPKTVVYDSAYGTLPSTSRSGYVFVGWFTSAGIKVTASSRLTTVGTQTLLAHWAKSRLVRFNANHGTLSVHSKTVGQGLAYGTLPVPKRAGYAFSGWYTKESGGTHVTAASRLTATKTTTLYAHWRKVTTPSGHWVRVSLANPESTDHALLRDPI